MSQELYANIGALIGYLVLGASGASAVTFFLFKLFAEKWMSSKFNQQLESFKHQQQREIEELRFRIGTMMDRAIKLHQREFEVLPETWSRMSNAFGAVAAISIGLNRFNQVDRMSDVEIKEVLNETNFSESVKARIVDATGDYRQRLYLQHERWRRKNIAGKALGDFEEYLEKNGVFVSSAIKEKFTEMVSFLRGAYFELEADLENEGAGIGWEERRKISKEAKALRGDIEKMVQERLWNYKGQKDT